ncbi:MAG: TlpA disulfide reductase family protein [Planctomycetota bacterium]|jgi:thiol-disulfide isomerase/thioredoxin
MIAAVLLLSSLLGPQGGPNPESAATGDVPLQTGIWRAWLDCRAGELPFHLELRKDPLRAWIINGEERIAMPRVEVADGQLVIGIDYYDSKITAKIEDEGKALSGEWYKRRGAEREVRMAFHAVAGQAPRFAVEESSSERADISGRWSVNFDGDEYPAVGIFSAEPNGKAAGTFLTALGDYRFLAGRVDGNQMRLSCFDGAHAFRFDAELDASGKLHGKFWSSMGRPQAWTATRDADASLENPYELTSWQDGEIGSFTYPDLEGRPRRLDDPEFAGKARLIVVFGSWCPNCKDETEYLVELDEKYGDRGLSILGLAFELTGDLKRDCAQVQSYAKHHGVEYPILVAGISDKAAATKAFPVLDRVRSYPTTIFMDEKGEVRAIHTGFSGPATGEEHAKLRANFEAHIEALLSGN